MTSPTQTFSNPLSRKQAAALTPFRHSRIYAEGWNAARKSSGGSAPAPNPYKTEPERARWAEGFAGALA